MGTRRIAAELADDEGPMQSHAARWSVAVAQRASSKDWRIVVALEAPHAIDAGELLTADFDPLDLPDLIDALELAADAVRRGSLS